MFLLRKARKLEGRTTVHGIPVSVETRRGGTRQWKNPDNGTEGMTHMRHPYGYFTGGPEAVDGDKLDCFIGPHRDEATHVYVIHQTKAPDFIEYDEPKCMCGFLNAKAAVDSYFEHYSDPGFFGGIDIIPAEEFKAIVEGGGAIDFRKGCEDEGWTTVTVTLRDRENSLVRLLQDIKAKANVGHSYEVITDPDAGREHSGRHGIDGDGGFYIKDIKVDGEDPDCKKAMTGEELYTALTKSQRPTICVDFDGVIADYSKGWQGADVFGEPLPGAADCIMLLKKTGAKIIIFTTRKADVGLENYLRFHGIPFDEINSNSEQPADSNPGKPIADVYIDDRAIRFSSWKQTMGDLRKHAGVLAKSHVKQHTRRLASGKAVIVRAHEDRRTKKPEYIVVDGRTRPVDNSLGRPIAATPDAVRNFWRWFKDSKAVDEHGRPLVFYHGTTAIFDEFKFNRRTWHDMRLEKDEEHSGDDLNFYRVTGGYNYDGSLEETRVKLGMVMEVLDGAEGHKRLLVGESGPAKEWLPDDGDLLEHVRDLLDPEEPVSDRVVENPAFFFTTDGPYTRTFSKDYSDREWRHFQDGNELTMPVYLSVQNPLGRSEEDWAKMRDFFAMAIMKANGGRWKPECDEGLANCKDWFMAGRWEVKEAFPHFVAYAKSKGYDGFASQEGTYSAFYGHMLRGEDVQGIRVFGVFDPKHIKSATGNSGSFDPDSPKITKATRGHVAYIRRSKKGKVENVAAKAGVKKLDTTTILKPKNTGRQQVGITGKTEAALRKIAEQRGLKVPPAWTEIWVNVDKKAGLQVKGRDKKGVLQRLYSTAHHGTAHKEKHDRVKEFAKAYPAIMRQVNADFPKRDEARVLYLISRTGFRAGGDKERGEVKSYGACNLTREHTDLTGNRINFSFTGKKGGDNDHFVTDAKLAEYVRKVKKGRLFKTDDQGVRTYLKEIGYDHFLVKDFRTHIANELALATIKKMPNPKTPQEYKKAVKAVCEVVAKKLGNGWTMARDSYISPEVFSKWTK